MPALIAVGTSIFVPPQKTAEAIEKRDQLYSLHIVSETHPFYTEVLREVESSTEQSSQKWQRKKFGAAIQQESLLTVLIDGAESELSAAAATPPPRFASAAAALVG